MNNKNVIFCGASIGLSILAAALFYPYAALTSNQISKAKTVVDAEQLDTMDLGDFGDVAVTELVDYYIENPPKPVDIGTVQKKVRFEGC